MCAQPLQSCWTLWDPMDGSLLGSSVHGILQGKNTGVGCHALLQGIFPIQGSNPQCIVWPLHSRQMLYLWATWKLLTNNDINKRATQHGINIHPQYHSPVLLKLTLTLLNITNEDFNGPSFDRYHLVTSSSLITPFPKECCHN